ncbi:NUDIX hydrolase [Pseudofrankia sp. BMG5.36]|uniref:NUDIX hydrolase n=1 Tax=Pseudofrankia sp. BMG5.36 TaxID=1834512 RepID=UPI000B2F6804|nr:NUDIX hydrolase [Pseudofrankia sp. BMG5.36]
MAGTGPERQAVVLGTDDDAAEAAFLSAYDPRRYEPIAVTVDVVALTIRVVESVPTLHVLLVRRGQRPFVGRWALPGGFVRPATGPDGARRDEDLPEAAVRELAEETGLAASTDRRAVDRRLARVYLEQLGTYGTPGRDPRMRVISVAYLAFAPDLPDPTAGGDAETAAWVPVVGVDRDHMAFDHARILDDALERAGSKLEYTPLATAFVATEFTITELREVYEAVWGQPLHAPNFHRKVLSAPGFVEDTGATTARGGARGGRRARLYRAGTARLLHPALLRPGQEEPR